MVPLLTTSAILVLSFCRPALTFSSTNMQNPLSDEFINRINSKQNSWKAGRNFPPNTPLTYIKKLMGVLPDHNINKLPKVYHDAELIANLPEHFEPREKWPNCPSLNEIRDQGACGSCWAVVAAEAMTDRYCIYSNGTRQFHFSGEDILSCCNTCGNGCDGGNHAAAWLYWRDVGVVSGGNYNSSQGCRPYDLPPCEHHNIPGQYPPCGHNVPTPKCDESCISNYNVEYKKDKRFGRNIYAVGTDEEQIKAELFKNGPLESTLTIYADFIHYKQGVYKHSEGDKLGHHAVKLLGWGIEEGQKYWLVANSWNTDWGNKGFFKILRGVNHCTIEFDIVTGDPIIA